MPTTGAAKYHFKLFVSGKSGRARRAIENLRVICELYFPEQYELAIIDIRENPAAAEQERIIAVPTLVKTSPEPPCRVVGDLSVREKVLAALDILPFQEN